MRAHVLHQPQTHYPGLRVGLGILVVFLLVILAIAFQLYQSGHNPYLPYDAQESEAK